MTLAERIAELRSQLENAPPWQPGFPKAHETYAFDGHEAALIGDSRAALPDLLAIAEAAEAYRLWVDEEPERGLEWRTEVVNRWRALCATLDAFAKGVVP